MPEPTCWEEAASNAIAEVYSMDLPAGNLGTLREGLDLLIDSAFGQPDSIPLFAETVACVGHCAYTFAHKSLPAHPDKKAAVYPERILSLLISKQRDYGHNNILRFGVDGLIVRMNDKVARLENLLGNGREPANESLADTFADIIGYSVIGLMLSDGTFTLELKDT